MAATREKCEEVMDWLLRTFRFKGDEKDIRADWYRVFMDCTDVEMSSAKHRLATEYNSTFAPTTAIFLDYAGSARQRISSSLNHNPMLFWKDEETGMEFADPTKRADLRVPGEPLMDQELQEKFDGWKHTFDRRDD